MMMSVSFAAGLYDAEAQGGLSPSYARFSLLDKYVTSPKPRPRIAFTTPDRMRERVRRRQQQGSTSCGGSRLKSPFASAADILPVHDTSPQGMVDVEWLTLDNGGGNPQRRRDQLSGVGFDGAPDSLFSRPGTPLASNGGGLDFAPHTPHLRASPAQQREEEEGGGGQEEHTMFYSGAVNMLRPLSPPYRVSSPAQALAGLSSASALCSRPRSRPSTTRASARAAAMTGSSSSSSSSSLGASRAGLALSRPATAAAAVAVSPAAAVDARDSVGLGGGLGAARREASLLRPFTTGAVQLTGSRRWAPVVGAMSLRAANSVQSMAPSPTIAPPWRQPRALERPIRGPQDVHTAFEHICSAGSAAKLAARPKRAPYSAPRPRARRQTRRRDKRAGRSASGGSAGSAGSAIGAAGEGCAGVRTTPLSWDYRARPLSPPAALQPRGSLDTGGTKLASDAAGEAGAVGVDPPPLLADAPEAPPPLLCAEGGVGGSVESVSGATTHSAAAAIGAAQDSAPSSPRQGQGIEDAPVLQFASVQSLASVDDAETEAGAEAGTPPTSDA